MAFVATKGKFHIALDGVGLLLQGAPDRPAYKSDAAPMYGSRFASGDRDYTDLSLWWYLTQTDWSGGIKDTLSFADDAKYFYNSNIDAWSQPGSIKLARKQAAVHTFTEDILCATENYNNSSLLRYYGTADGAGGKPLVYEEDAGVYTDVFAAGVTSSRSAISQIVGNGAALFILSIGTDTADAVETYQGTQLSDKTADIDTVTPFSPRSSRTGALVDGVMYIVVDAIDVNDFRYSIVRSAAENPGSTDWALVKYEPNGGAVVASAGYAGDFYYMVYRGSTIDLRKYSVATTTDVSIRVFKNVTLARNYALGNLLTVANGKLIITIPTESVWTWNGSSLDRIYQRDTLKKALSTPVATGNLAGGAIASEEKAWWGNLMYDGESLFNTVKPTNDSTTETLTPLFSNSTEVQYYVESTDIKKVVKIDPNGTSYKDGASSSAFLIFSQHDKIQSIDKLFNSFTVGFNQLASGQSIEVYYTSSPDPTVPIADWTLLGTASNANDGAVVTFKTFLFPEGTAMKKCWFRINLLSTTSGTPVVNDITLEYLPIPDYKKQWVLNINVADEVMTLAGRHVETTARELKSRLEKAWMTKSALDFQDLDYATTLVDGSLSSSATTVTVDNTVDFPEQGRLKVDSEEMFYTGKTPTTFTGVTRGVRGTRAVAHSDNSVINNAFRVLVLDFEAKVPVALEDKNLEYIVGLSLREV